MSGKPVFGMPGYPSSCLSNAYMLLVPALRLMARLPPHHAHTVQLPLAQRVVSTTGRHQFYTVRIVDGQARPAFKASGDITSMAHADGYIEIPAQTDIVEKGQTRGGEALLGESGVRWQVSGAVAGFRWQESGIRTRGRSPGRKTRDGPRRTFVGTTSLPFIHPTYPFIDQ